MNEVDLLNETAKKLKKTKVETEKTINVFLKVMQETLASDKSITLNELGTFSTCTRAARKGKDPKTKKTVTIPACKTVRFTPGEKLKAVISKNL